MNKPTLKTTVLSIAVIMALFGAFALGSLTPKFTTGSSQGIPHVDFVNTVMRHADGTVFFNETNHNVLTTIGTTYIRDGMSTGTLAGAAKYISLSADASPLVSWTKLPNEFTTNGLDRQTGTVTNINASAYQVQVTFTAGGAQAGIVAEGLNWVVTDNTDNNLAAAAAISSASVIAGDTIQATWQVHIPPG